jgi:chorismate synthase
VLSSFGKNIQVNIYGGSHEPEIGVIMDGFPVGTKFDMEQLQRFMDRRAPGNSPFATTRKEPDTVMPVSGLILDGSTASVSATEIKLVIKNTNTRSQDYKNLRDIPRPGHADYTAFIKYGN